MLKTLKQNSTGFTLVELLVVISIIGLLSSFAVVSLNTARAKARDALRKGDMAQIRTAMNIYYDDKMAYPVCGTWDPVAPFGAPIDQQASADCYFVTLNTALTGGVKPYMGSMPKDPRNVDNKITTEPNFLYRYVSDGRSYALIYRLEEEPTIDQVIRGW